MPADVELRGASKDFGPVRAVAPMSLRIEPGTFVSLVGPSGCGKSTLLRLVAGLVAPTDGSVLLGGEAPAVARRRKHIAIVPQSPGLLPWRSVRDNARLLLEVNRGGTDPSHPDPDDLVREVGLDEFADLYPHQLSGGMQQRVALVRGFSLGAPLLLLDEPFAALDEITRREMRALLARLLERHPATVLLVTHSIDEAVFLSDRVLLCSPRPATIVADIAVTLERPRRDGLEDAPDFVRLTADVRHRLREAMG